jgi:hypothetical protein
MAIYDKAKWHFDGDFPKDLPTTQGYVHIGFYLGWVIDRGLAGSLLLEDFAEEVAQYCAHVITSTRLLQITDGVLDHQMLSEEGARFTADYYSDPDRGYLADYLATFPRQKSLYHVEDSPENFEMIKQLLDVRYQAWKARRA